MLDQSADIFFKRRIVAPLPAGTSLEGILRVDHEEDRLCNRNPARIQHYTIPRLRGHAIYIESYGRGSSASLLMVETENSVSMFFKIHVC